jgi:hypothetical protein
MTTVVAQQSPSVTGSKELTMNQFKSNQTHPSPTKQQQLRTKMVVLGFSALDDALCLEQNMGSLVFVLHRFIANPGSEPTRSSAGYHPKDPSGITQGATRIDGCAKLRCLHLWMSKLRSQFII